jgi:hypothetical protein
MLYVFGSLLKFLFFIFGKLMRVVNIFFFVPPLSLATERRQSNGFSVD